MTNYQNKKKANIIKPFIITVVFINIVNFLNAQDSKELIISGSDTTITESFELSNNQIFSSFAVKGSWTDNFGNYGKNKCMGIINKNSKNVELYFMCERVDQKGYKMWTLSKRKSSTQDSGVGIFEIVDTTMPKKELIIGKKCKYAVKYLENTNFYKSKCKISEELASIFEKIGSEN